MGYHVISALAADAFKNAVIEIAIVRGGLRQDESHFLAAGGAKWLYGSMWRKRIGIACVGHVEAPLPYRRERRRVSQPPTPGAWPLSVMPNRK